jgi:large subunit ribosomal protein L35
MPKIKTKSGAKKRFRVTANGLVSFNKSKRRHMMSNKSQKMKRQSRSTDILFKTDGENVRKYWLPYA